MDLKKSRPTATTAVRRITPPWTLTALLASSLLAGCLSDKPEASKPSAPGGGAPQVPVGVVQVQPESLQIVTELPGRIEASRTAQVRARSAGIVQKRLFTEGTDVRAGQALFQIDAAPYEAAVQNAEAALARAQAQAVQAAAQRKRFAPLVAANAISQQDFDNADAADKQAQAEVKAAQAQLRSAKISLGYANVTAPIAGRIGRALVTEGALVGQGEPTPLALIQQIDPVYVNFTQSASEIFKLRQHLQGQGKQDSSGVEVMLEDGSVYPHSGKLLFSDLSVDAGTGQVTLRAEVPNPDGLLLPGLYVRIRMDQGQAENAFALPQQAVTRSERGDTVIVVSAAGTTERRPVSISMGQGNRWLVHSGLQAGEQVMVDGFQKLQMMPPGTLFKPVPWQQQAGQPADNSPAPDSNSAPSDADATPQQS